RRVLRLLSRTPGGDAQPHRGAALGAIATTRPVRPVSLHGVRSNDLQANPAQAYRPLLFDYSSSLRSVIVVLFSLSPNAPSRSRFSVVTDFSSFGLPKMSFFVFVVVSVTFF